MAGGWRQPKLICGGVTTAVYASRTAVANVHAMLKGESGLMSLDSGCPISRSSGPIPNICSSAVSICTFVLVKQGN